MADVQWPASLQQLANSEGYSSTFGDNLLTSNEFDIGEPQTRLRSTSAPDEVNLSVELDQTYGEYETFVTFYKDSLLHGSLKFDWKDPITQEIKEFKFKEKPSFSHLGGNLYRVTMMLRMYKYS